MNLTALSTLLVTIMIWRSTAHSIMSATSRNRGQIRAGEKNGHTNIFQLGRFMCISAARFKEFEFMWIFSNSASGLPIDTVHWDLCSLPIRTSSIDIIISDMPFGKRYNNNTLF